MKPLRPCPGPYTPRNETPWIIFCWAFAIIGIAWLAWCVLGNYSGSPPGTPQYFPAGARKHLSEPVLLHAIATVESPDGKPGKAGELGYWQLSPVVMALYRADGTTEPPQVWWLHQLEVKNQSFDPRTLFTLWNPGQPEETTQREMALYQKFSQLNQE